jgi:syndecan 2
LAVKDSFYCVVALIGGGVVLLLCLILIVLFIAYRVRKKDEGSYPLGDEKPLKNYAYSKAPSQEFYA